MNGGGILKTKKIFYEKRIYQLSYIPPKTDFQEYIIGYKKEGNKKCFEWFLHYYENILNSNVEEYMKKYFMPEHFADLKQAYVIGLYRALKVYDISSAIPFLVFKERYVERYVLEYIRTMRTGYTVHSTAEYARLRKTMAVWDKYDRDYSEDTLSKISAETGDDINVVKDIIRGGLLNENMAEFNIYYDENSDNNGVAGEEYITDYTTDTFHILTRQELYSKVMVAYENLEYRERVMLAQRLGFCPECYSPYYMDNQDLDEYGNPKKKLIRPMMYTDIATDHGLSSANTVKNICEKALLKIKGQVLSDN